MSRVPLCRPGDCARGSPVFTYRYTRAVCSGRIARIAPILGPNDSFGDCASASSSERSVGRLIGSGWSPQITVHVRDACT